MIYAMRKRTRFRTLKEILVLILLSISLLGIELIISLFRIVEFNRLIPKCLSQCRHYLYGESLFPKSLISPQKTLKKYFFTIPVHCSKTLSWWGTNLPWLMYQGCGMDSISRRGLGMSKIEDGNGRKPQF